MNNFTAQSLVIVAQVMLVIATLVQYIKIITTKTTKGLSGWSYTLVTGSILAWTIYGFSKGLVVFYVAHLITALICLVILGHLYVQSKTRRKMELYSFIAGITLVLLFVKFPIYAGWVGLTYSVLSRLPQYGHLFNDNNIRGVSSLAHLFNIIACVCTVIYSYHYEMLPLMISAAYSIASSLFIMFMVAKKSIRAYN